MDHIQQNISSHDKIYRQYGQRHTEIYNDIEQNRLTNALARAKKHLKTKTKQPMALDYGCGDGNLTMHLLELGFKVTAADITETFLSLIKERFPSPQCQTMLINGIDLKGVPSSSYDVVATYSVLHHIPDYQSVLKEFCRVLKPGGILYLDHERNDEFWHPTPQLSMVHRFIELKQAESRVITRHNLPTKIKSKLGYWSDIKRVRADAAHKKMLKQNPRYQEEGDIHVFMDDHVEWDKIIRILTRQKCQVLFKDDFLLHDSRLYTPDEYAVFSQICTDESCLTAIKQ